MRTVYDKPRTDAAPETGAPGVFEHIELFQAWDRDYYHPLARPFYDRAVKQMLGALNCPAGGRILDAGCGPGEHSIRAARQGHDVVGLDLSETVLAEARRRVNEAGVSDRITFKQGDLTRLDFADESFPAIFCWGVIIHIPAIEQALDELVRVLQPGGRLALYVTNMRAWDHRLMRLMRWMLRKPAVQYERLALGRGRWHASGPEPLWVWHVDVPALTGCLEARGMTRVARWPGEFTELQRRVHGRARNLLLRWNRAYGRLGLPAGPCADNLLVFEKNG